jgi:hypothetical protein
MLWICCGFTVDCCGFAVQLVANPQQIEQVEFELDQTAKDRTPSILHM